MERKAGWGYGKGYHRTSPYPHVDHIKPVCNGGTDDLDNLSLACAFCNMAKGDAPVEEFLEWLDAVRFGPTWAPIKDVLKLE